MVKTRYLLTHMYTHRYMKQFYNEQGTNVYNFIL